MYQKIGITEKPTQYEHLKVGEIVQYYADKILDALDQALAVNQCE